MLHFMNDRRTEKFRKVARGRQPNITVILENVLDTHNIGAVLRSADSVGLMEIFLLYNEVGLDKEIIKLGKRSSAGTRKWIDVHYYKDTRACFDHVRSLYQNVYSTKLDENAKGLYDLDLSASVALLFGNEKDGVTELAASLCDGNYIIPQVGMAESLNISVACAISLYEAYRQRNAKGYYDVNPLLSEKQQQQLFEKYASTTRETEGVKKVTAIKP